MVEIIWDVDFSAEDFPPRYLPNSPFAAPEGSEGPQVDDCEAGVWGGRGLGGVGWWDDDDDDDDDDGGVVDKALRLKEELLYLFKLFSF